MAKYNLVRNGYLKALTSSGTGNVDLSITQLERLVDGNKTSSGVTITSSGVLFLELDLSNRIKLDGIRLYANDLSKSADIKFYYKNYEEDSYTLLSTISGAYYSTTISSPSAPRFILTTISGIDITLYEFEVFNDDYVVAFGEDGSLYAANLPNTPLGYESDAQPVAVYNNGTDMMPADAYTCIDYTGSDADRYLKISASENGTYVKLEDGALIEDDNLSSKYFWTMGKLEGDISVYGDDVMSEYHEATILDKTTVMTVPLLEGGNSFNAQERCWDYDSINDVVYVIGCDPNKLKLWRFKYNQAAFEFISAVDVVTTSSRRTSICYWDNKIYCLPDGNTRFGYYDLAGAAENWTLLASHPQTVLSTTRTKRNLCNDYKGNLYCIDFNWNASATKYFYKYNIATNSWSVLDNGYFMSGANDTGSICTWCHIWYDQKRDYIYTVIGMRDLYDSNRYIQRYRVADDAWDPQYLYIGDLYTAGFPVTRIMAHSEDTIYFTTNSLSNTVWAYDLLTATWTNKGVDFTFAGITSVENYSNHFMAFDTASGVVMLAANLTTRNQVRYDGPIIEIHSEWWTGGTYTSPIFQLDDKTQSSYFLIDGTTTGSGSISYDPDVYNGTIRVRSSNEEPVVINEVHSTNSGPSSYPNTNRWDVYPDIKYTNISVISSTRGTMVRGITVANNRTGEIVRLTRMTTNTRVWIDLFSRNGDLILSDAGPSVSNRNYFDVNAQFDATDGLWGYGIVTDGGGADGTQRRLVHFNSLFNTILANISDSYNDFLYDLAAEINDTGVWYTNKIDNLVVHLDSNGTSMNSIVLPEPRAICGTSDNGCWVFDSTESLLKRYTQQGVLVEVLTAPINITYMTDDGYDGIWYINTEKVGHMDENGIVDVDFYLPGYRKVYKHTQGCVVYSTTTRAAAFINRAAGAVAKTWSSVANVTTHGIGVMSIDIESQITNKFGLINNVPASYDPVWGSSGPLQWKEVRKDGYYLPKHKYHQVEVTLRDNATLEKIIMAPAIRTQDIQSKSYKNIYLKTDVPGDALIDAYEARLKTWWGVND